MAEVDDGPKFGSLRERIDALQRQQVADQAGSATSPAPAPAPSAKRPPPPPPPSAPPLRPRSAAPPPVQAPPLPRRTVTSPFPSQESREPTETASPALPPRRPSLAVVPGRANLSRRDSASSEISAISLGSQARRLLPPENDVPPPLPPTRREKEAAGSAVPPAAPPSRPDLPPRLPSRLASRSPAARPAEQPEQKLQLQPQPQEQPQPTPNSTPPPPPSAAPRRLPPPAAGFIKSPFANGQQRQQQQQQANGSLPDQSRPPATPALSRDFKEPPPPVPLASRPSEAQIEATVARLAIQHACLSCRDFSGPDRVAAQYPTRILPRQGTIDFLAHALCDPFPSLTDKARAVFSWMHHNVAYDTAGFFGGNIRRLGPEDTIFSGVAVCAGYADTYRAIVAAAGLQCVVVGGHGKGFGFKPMRAGDPAPARNATGHAWNAVRIDGGEWKLIDACWGAGNVDGSTQSFNKAFKPSHFTAPNDVFGLSHFPENDGHFYRRDGRVVSWEEYIMGATRGRAPVTVFSSADREGISAASMAPADGDISVRGAGVVRFQFSLHCEHWDPRVNGAGAPLLLLLSINGRDGRQADNIPLQTEGSWFWIDVDSVDLGTPGQTVSVVALETFDNQPARGITVQQYLAKKGRVGSSWSGVAKWNLV